MREREEEGSGVREREEEGSGVREREEEGECVVTLGGGHHVSGARRFLDARS